MGYKDYDDKLLMLLLESTHDDKMQKYIESILLERYSDFRDIGSLYRRINKSKVRTENMLWTSIAVIIASGKFICDVSLLNEIIENMPMNDLAIISNSDLTDKKLMEYAKIVCYRKQEEYEREIGIYDKGHLFKCGKLVLFKRRG